MLRNRIFRWITTCAPALMLLLLKPPLAGQAFQTSSADTTSVSIANDRIPGFVDSSRVVAGGVEFGSITDAVVGHDGRVYIADLMADSLTCISPSGRVLWKSGGKGGGPGEFTMLYRLAVDAHGKVYAFDLGSNDISTFDRNGRFIRRRHLTFQFAQLNNFVVAKSGEVIAAGVTLFGAARHSAIHFFDDALGYERSIGSLPIIGGPRPDQVLRFWGAGFVSQTAAGNEIVYVRSLPYDIYRFSLSGSLIDSIAAPFNFERGPEDAFQFKEEPGRQEVRASKDTVPRPGQAFDLGNLLLGQHMDEHGRISIDAFAENGGRLLWSRLLPDFLGVVIGIDSTRRVIWTAGERDLRPAVYQIFASRLWGADVGS